jgi:hypothetical protein
LGSGAIAGIVIASVLVVGIGIFAGVWFLSRTDTRRLYKKDDDFEGPVVNTE